MVAPEYATTARPSVAETVDGNGDVAEPLRIIASTLLERNP